MWLTTIAFIYLANVWPNVGADDCKLNDLISSDALVFHDLSHQFDANTVYWPYSKSFKFTNIVAEDGANGWYAANDFEAGEHGGTHMDAPYHFHREGKFVGEIPMEKLIVPLVIVDISSHVNGDPNFVLHKHQLDDILIKDNNGKPCMIIFKFGWTKFYGDKQKYLGMNETDGTLNLNFPGIGEDVAEWITTSYKNVVGVGLDTASVDPGSSTAFATHKVLMTAGLYHMENVKLDTPVPEYDCTGVALPMKIAKGTGGPLRLAAICPKTAPTTF